MERKYRMYGLVAYQLCGTIHAGIQFGHAVQEYNNKILEYIDKGISFATSDADDYLAFKCWSRNDKTFIILNGGTTNKSLTREGTLNKHLANLEAYDIPVATFYEPDLGDQLTAVVFLVDDRVWDKEAYPEWDKEAYPDYILPNMFYPTSGYDDWSKQFEAKSKTELYKILFMRDFLKQFKLA